MEILESCSGRAVHLKRFGDFISIVEQANPADTLTFDVPALIRTLEFAREDIKTDNDLHVFVENLLVKTNQGADRITMETIRKVTE